MPTARKTTHQHLESHDPAAKLATIGSEVDRFIAAWLDEVQLCPELRAAAKYALLGGGKRLRPSLAWMACEAVCSDGRASLRAGAAVELIHAFSLVHDDLPAMDDDDLRRGRPTLHIHAGEAMAILAGDVLLSLSFELLCGAPASTTGGENPSLSARLCRELAIGTRGMIDGQVLDTLGSEQLGTLSEAKAVEAIHTRKTGALIVAAIRMGGLCGLAEQGEPLDGPKLEALDAYGRAVGLMFQAVDDLLDVESTTEKLGKRAGKDAQAGKKTYPGVFGVEGTRELIRTMRSEATRAALLLDDLTGQAGAGTQLAELAKWLADRRA